MFKSLFRGIFFIYIPWLLLRGLPLLLQPLHVGAGPEVWHLFYKIKFKVMTVRYSMDPTITKNVYISTRSTLTPQWSVALSSVCSMAWLMVSRSDKISARYFVPRTVLRVVAANKWVECLKDKIPSFWNHEVVSSETLLSVVY